MSFVNCGIRFNVIASMIIALTMTACTTTGSPSSEAKTVPEVDLFMLSVDAQRAYQQSRWFDAVRLYQEIVEHVPDDSAAWFRLANTFAQQGAYEQAIHAYEQSLLYNREQAKAWFNLSTAYLLHAQSAMRQSLSMMANTDPAAGMVQQRLQQLDELMLAQQPLSSSTRSNEAHPNPLSTPLLPTR